MASNVRIIRDGVVVYTGLLGSLKRFKDDVKEVAKGFECGLNIEKFNDLKGGDIFEAYEIDAVDGVTDCPELDSAVYGTSDIRALLDDLDWGVAIGSLGDVEAPLEAAVTGDGGDWDTDWAPYVHGNWVTWDRSEVQALGYTFNYNATCDEVLVDDGGAFSPLAVATDAPVEAGLRLGSGYFVLPFEDVTGIECDVADVDIGDAAWTPDSGTMTNIGFLPTIDVVQDRNGNLVDYYLDEDGDGSEDSEVSASYGFLIFDTTTGTTLCTAQFDASGLTPVDVDSLTVQDAANPPNTGAELSRAWSFTVTDLESDCSELDPAVYPTDNLLELLDGLTFTFGIGPMAHLENEGSAYWGTDWDTLQPFLHSEFFGFGTTTVREYAYGVMFDTDNCNSVDEQNAGAFQSPAAVEGVIGYLRTYGYYFYFT